MKDHANFEWGRRERTGTATPSADAEGGFVTTLGPGKLGAQVGRATDFTGLIREVNIVMADVPLNTTGSTLAEGQNTVDVLYGGGTDLRWGGGIAITRSKFATGNPSQQSSVQGYDLRGGINTDTFEAYGSLLLGAFSKTDLGTASASFNESFGLQAGGAFQVMTDLKLFAQARYDKFNASRGDTVDYDGKRFGFTGGAAMVRAFENNARLIAAAELNYVDANAKDNKSKPEEKYSVLSVPLTLGLEADANTWLRMRGSVRQNVLIGQIKSTSGNTANDSNSYENAPNDTSVAFGAGASLNKFNFDVALLQSLGDDHGRVEASMTYLF